MAAYDAAGDHLAASGITLADIGDIRQDLVVQRCDRGGFPVGFADVGTEFLRMAEGRILPGNVFP